MASVLGEEKSTKGQSDTDGQELGLSPSGRRVVARQDDAPYDEVFGKVTDDGPNYRGLGWKGTVILMMKTQIGLGVLSMPQTFDNVGMIPGVLLLLAVAAIATWTSWVVGMFKLNHPSVYGIDDAGYIMFGRVGREVLGTFFCLFWIFCGGSGILGASIALNSISLHGTCTAVFVVIAAIASGALASVRTLSKISWLAWAGMAFILAASKFITLDSHLPLPLPPPSQQPSLTAYGRLPVLTVTISVGVQDRPTDAPPGPWKSDYRLFGDPTFAQGVSAVSTFIFSCSAAPAYFAIVAEMRDPKKYTRSLIIAQIGSTSIYLVIAVVIYYYCGSYVASPALGSAGPLVKRVAYGLSLPGLLITTCIFLHLPAKYIFVRILRGSRHLSANTAVHWGTWLGCTVGTTLIAYLIASGIPIFGDLVSLIGAFLGASLGYQPPGFMWLYDNWKTDRRTWKWYTLVSWSVFLVVVGTFLTVGGTYGAVINIIKSLDAGGTSKPWACADNSNSV
ncbi:Transmembrane amino acid transporter protein [Geosmithia morbida]|uniref:Transmembrane amino acid transporter protein n=1 Tax=Geosmithia morbida TaxID=1094350 RepID=A0A9P4YWN6_9HYPO|nr:Transmembrane amino acid transporter protein [Geosmithia morbida]KAF4123043.1 Transmembrane amino acid transporter protein [Geosmithia morbida]